MKLVCGTDFSKYALAAADVAAALAGRTGDTIDLYYVMSYAGFGPVASHVVDDFEAQARKYLREEAQRLREKGVTVNENLRVGLPDEVILNAVSPETTHLVVVGSVGHRDPGRWQLGSISEHVAERSKVPTLVVRSAEPFLAWSMGRRPLRVFLACDLRETSDDAFKWLRDFQAIGSCDIIVGHVNSPLEEQNRLGLQGPVSLVENAPEVQKRLEDQLKEKVTKLLGDVPCRIRVSPCLGQADCGLIEAAQEEKADMLVTGTHQAHGLARLWHHSVSRALLHYAPMSVVVVPSAPV